MVIPVFMSVVYFKTMTCDVCQVDIHFLLTNVSPRSFKIRMWNKNHICKVTVGQLLVCFCKMTFL